MNSKFKTLMAATFLLLFSYCDRSARAESNQEKLEDKAKPKDTNSGDKDAQKRTKENGIEAKLEVLKSIEEKSEQLKIQEIEIKKMSSELDIQKLEVEKKIAYLEQLRSALAKKLDQKAVQDEKAVRDMTKVVEAMNPKAASKMFEDIDIDLAREMLHMMNPKKSAEILSKLPKERAIQISEYFSGYHEAAKSSTMESMERKKKERLPAQAEQQPKN